MTFRAVFGKIEFSWSPSMALPWTCYWEGNHSSPRPQLHLTLHFFHKSLLKSYFKLGQMHHKLQPR